MARKSRRLFLPCNDIDVELVRDGIRYQEGELPVDPCKIVGSEPRKISQAVTKEHEEVLKRK